MSDTDTDVTTFQIDADKVTFDDLEMFDPESGKKPSIKAYMDFLDRVVEGGVRGKGYPVKLFRPMVQAALGTIMADEEKKD